MEFSVMLFKKLEDGNYLGVNEPYTKITQEAVDEAMQKGISGMEFSYDKDGNVCSLIKIPDLVNI